MSIKEILESDDLLSLYEEVNLIYIRNSQLYKDLKEYPEATYANINKKEELSLNNNKLSALQAQITLLKNIIDRNNHNFRMVAKMMLSKEVYNTIYKQSLKSLRESREELKKLNQIKLEL